MYVEVFQTTPEGQELWFTAKYADGEVDLTEVPDGLKTSWEKFGIPYRGKAVKPNDGEVFLKAIARDFNGSMVRSNDVVEGK